MPNWTKEQSLAINENGKNIIVSAGAGSGKTAVLSERVLKKIESGVDIDHLLILTFTKAAANEMKARIRKKIKSNELLMEQLNRLDNSYITTFDSYSLSIVKKYHYLLNVKKNVSIIEESVLSIKKESFLEEILERQYQEKNPAFIKLVSDFCIKDDELIKNAILSINRKLDMKYDKSNYLNNYIESKYSDDYIKKNISDYVTYLLDKIKYINILVEKLSEYVDGDYISLITNSLEKMSNSRTYEDIRNSIFVKLPNLKRGTEEQGKLIKKELTESLKELAELVTFEDTNELYQTIYSTLDYAKSIISIIKLLDEKVNSYKNSNDLYDFNDISKMAIKVIKENPIIRDEIKNYFQEILVDEYQDTNDLQEDFISMIANNNLYMVGDVKQSIYRFRNANPNIFRNKYNNYSKNNGGIKIDLLKNFRSREEVLKNINLMFDYIMDDDIGGAYYRIEHEMVFGNTSYNEKGFTPQNNDLEIYAYPYVKENGYTKEEIEAFTIANDIVNKVNSHYQVYDKDNGILRDITYNDFSILIDRSTSFDLYKKVFFYKHIPLNIFRDEYLTGGDILLVIKNIFKLISIIDKTSKKELTYCFLSIGRSFLFNYTDDYLFNVIKNDSYDETIIWNKIKKIKENIDSKSIKNIFDDIIQEFDFYNKLIEIGNVKDSFIRLDYLSNLCNNLQKMEYTYLDFVDYLDTIINKNLSIKFSLNKDDNNSVKIMTIHKSKGLEYHVCYFPGLSPKFNDQDIKEKFIYDNNLGIITPYFKEGIGTTFYRELFKNNYKKEEISEKIRLFYVALTRAKEKMIIILPDEEKTEEYNHDNLVDNSIRLTYNSFKDIVLSIKSQLSKYIVNININDLNLTHDYNIISSNNVFNNIKSTDECIHTYNYQVLDSNIIEQSHYSKSTIKLITKEEKATMKYGTDIHYILELLDLKNPNLKEINPKYHLMINKFLNSSLLANVYKANIYKEYEFISNNQNETKHGVIDLMLEYDEYIDIIDYKLKNINDKLYNEQLLGYKKYIENLTGKMVNTYLYSIMTGEYKRVS